MPELPEVETVVRDLIRAGIAHKKVLSIDVAFAKLIEVGAAAALIGATVELIERRGKYIIIRFSNKKCLLIHLRMTGRLLVEAPKSPPLPYEKAKIEFETMSLHFCDVRTFGRWYIVDDADVFLSHLGQDPLLDPFDSALFYQKLAHSQRAMKALLLDQSVVAGVGNIYADEVLFHAKIHPLRKASTLTKKEQRSVLSAIKEVLSQAVKNKGSSLGSGKGNFKDAYGEAGGHQNSLNAYQQHGEPCPRCGTPIEKITVSQRSTHFCPHCQI